ncbi:MAG: hypothetical protein H6661_04000 [Ardenticatenaceae bacterium]|nr:hypothetical protein [Ardenticatenaceae bacterium]
MPIAPNAPAFWQNIINKRYSIREVPPERWNPDFYYDPDPHAPDKTYSKIGGWVRGSEFDWRQPDAAPKVKRRRWTAVAVADDCCQRWPIRDLARRYPLSARPLSQHSHGRRTALYSPSSASSFLNMPTRQSAFDRFTTCRPTCGGRSRRMSAWRHRPAHPARYRRFHARRTAHRSGRVANLLNLRGPQLITDAACASSFITPQRRHRNARPASGRCGHRRRRDRT